MKPRILTVLQALLLALTLGISSSSGQEPMVQGQGALGTAFTYQGVLDTANGLVNDVCDFRFSLFDTFAGGDLIGAATRDEIEVVDGLFSVKLDFGADAFNGHDRWLETAVRCPSGAGSYTALTPRQEVSPAPYALVADLSRASIGDFTVNGWLWVHGPGIFGGPSTLGAITLLSPDLWMQADSSFDRGDGGRALVHEVNDTLSINHAGDFAGGVRITGNTTIDGEVLKFQGRDFEMSAGGDRGDGGRALTHYMHDSLVINFEEDFSGGVYIHGLRTLSAGGPGIDMAAEFKSPDIYLSADASFGRGDGGRALVHDLGDTLTINHEGDFAGGVRINDLRTGKIIEENLMTPEQRNDFSLLHFSRGDVLCWDGESQKLVKCQRLASPLVVAVADDDGKPIVLGAESVNVLGPVQPGDLLVASAEPGYALAWSRVEEGSPPVGVVIAKALDSCGEGKGRVKAMIFIQ